MTENRNEKLVELSDEEIEEVSGGAVATVGNVVGVTVNNALNNNEVGVNVAALGSGAFQRV